MSGKRYKKNKTDKKNNNRIISYIFLIIFITMMIFSGTKIFIWVKENIESRKIISSLEDVISIDNKINSGNKYSVDFEKLKKMNSDTVAWIKVNGTNIEYPVVKTNNNDFYLNHNFNRAYNGAGWVFMDYKNKLDGTDNNIVIFAHNRRDGSMFGSLKNILTEEWQEDKSNFLIPFITENQKLEYEVFSVYKIEKEEYYITTNFKNDVEFQEFINKVISRSDKDFGIEVTTKDELLTLSTCANDNRYRVVLHAKKIK